MSATLGSDFRSLMRRVPLPIAVVTTQFEGSLRAITVNSWNSVALAPIPVVSFCVKIPSRFYSMLAKSKSYSIHVLSEQNIAYSKLFATGSVREDTDERFSNIKYVLHPITKLPVLENVMASLQCKTIKEVNIEDHMVIFGEVNDMEIPETSNNLPLLYYGSNYTTVSPKLSETKNVESEVPFVISQCISYVHSNRLKLESVNEFLDNNSHCLQANHKKIFLQILKPPNANETAQDYKGASTLVNFMKFSPAELLELFTLESRFPDDFTIFNEVFSVDALEPALLTPLTSEEKEIYASGINSSSVLKKNDKKGKGRPKEKTQPIKQEKEELWDQPIQSNLGSFDENGVFREEKPAIASTMPVQILPGFNARPADLNLLITRIFQEFPMSTHPEYILNEFFARYQKLAIPEWLYLDPLGNVQGPFTGTEMMEWCEAGYFAGDLKIKRTFDPGFETLAMCAERYGNTAPFVLPPLEDILRVQQIASQRYIAAFQPPEPTRVAPPGFSFPNVAMGGMQVPVHSQQKPAAFQTALPGVNELMKNATFEEKHRDESVLSPLDHLVLKSQWSESSPVESRVLSPTEKQKETHSPKSSSPVISKSKKTPEEPLKSPKQSEPKVEAKSNNPTKQWKPISSERVSLTKIQKEELEKPKNIKPKIVEHVVEVSKPVSEVKSTVSPVSPSNNQPGKVAWGGKKVAPVKSLTEIQKEEEEKKKKLAEELQSLGLSIKKPNSWSAIAKSNSSTPLNSPPSNKKFSPATSTLPIQSPPIKHSLSASESSIWNDEQEGQFQKVVKKGSKKLTK